MSKKEFKFSENKSADQVCSIRKFHKVDEMVYGPQVPKREQDVITKCRECKTWLLVRFSQAPSARYTGQNAWRMVCRIATQEEIERYTREGKVKDV